MNKMRTPVFALTLLLLGGTPVNSQDRYPVRQLTSDSAREGFPSRSPDG